jgi:demethylmenaquinone methyltransferase/2-methoxy-6-polyprenyl-1,4-benzoquinol methylase
VLSALQPGGSALDICTGTGDLAGVLAGRVGERGEVVGVDFCPAMLERARLKYPRLRFVEGDALRLPLEGGRFDAATMAFGLRNLVDTRAGFAEMKRVLRPGGRALVLELTRPSGPLRFLYYIYLHFVLPLVGGLVSGNFTAYRYLANTIQAFLSPADICAQMRDAGFTEVRAYPLCGGIATIFAGIA